MTESYIHHLTPLQLLSWLITCFWAVFQCYIAACIICCIRGDSSIVQDSTLSQKDSTLEKINLILLEDNSTLPQKSSSIHQNTLTLPQETSVIPHNTSKVPQENSKIPQNTSTLPQENSTIPQNDFTLPQKNYTPPKNTSTLPKKISTLLHKNFTLFQKNSTLHGNDVISIAKVHKAVRNISIVGDEFMLDGRPLRIVSGSLHYFRVPASYWRDRLRKLKAAGLNSVSTYVEWSYHEPEERQYQMSGDRDVAQFVRAAAEEGLFVLLRVGPYICAERDMGGLPYWLLSKYPHIKLRTKDKDFIYEITMWLTKLFKQMTPLLFGNGGPIILVQVENEYGSFGNDKTYKEQVRDIIRGHVGTNALLYTTDGAQSSLLRNGSVEGALTTIDFGPGSNVQNHFDELREFMPKGPLMNSEFYTGWMTHWTEHIKHVNEIAIVNTLRDMLDRNISVNMYMFFGGTNFEFSSGANHDFKPDITSYDYDAPLNEAGDPTSKYFAIRQLLEKYNPELKNITPPTPAPKGAYGTVSVSLQIKLLSPEGRKKLGKRYSDVTGAVLPTFEELRQRAGLMLYETVLKNAEGILNIESPRDRIYVYVDNEYKGLIDRMNKQYNLSLNSKSNSTLSLLVENQGRLNDGKGMEDFKGIEGNVTFNGRVVNGSWTVTGYPLENVNVTIPTTKQLTVKFGPMLHEGEFTLLEGQKTLDTFLDTTDWGKGYVWINGHNLGRYQPGLGPQITLYVPGIWLKAAPAKNKLQILEIEQPADHLMMYFIDYPILNHTDFKLKPVGLCKDENTHVKEVTVVSSTVTPVSSATHEGAWLSKISKIANAFFARVVIPPYEPLNYFS